ncbi:DUF3658 domain-containing protein [Mesorhizobium sp. J8]|uniref:DUF3658 domain-containing protein n=1 Tax=Mesorhizobium sp. J8 TaxID=2777475 RepID=UPI0019161F9E|nr:DUF3658 domain-containing protein [Mesorhizobium sp. J8]BCM19586.1 hypothetical protein MJ8_33640 [Mesorhizobium sp. J8]
MTKLEKPVVHVVFNMSAAGSLRHALAHMGRHETVIGLPDDLSFGPIDPPAIDLRARWMEDVLGFERRPDLEQEADQFWRRATDRDVAAVAWVCRRSAMEFAGFLEFVSRIGDHPFRAVDVTEVEFAPRPDRSESTPWRTVSFGHVPADNIVKERLTERQAILTEQELQAYRGLWKRLRAENAPFRVVSDHSLQSAPITFFDKAVATHVTDDWRKCSYVVANCLGALWDDGTYCGDLVLWSRVRALADEGVFEMGGDGVRMRNSSVRLASGAV